MDEKWWTDFWNEDCADKQKKIVKALKELPLLFEKDMKEKDQYYHKAVVSMMSIAEDIRDLSRTKFIVKIMEKHVDKGE